MPLDALLLVEDVTSAKTTTYTPSAAFDLSSAGVRPTSPFWVRVNINEGVATTANISFDVLQSATSDGTFTLSSASDPVVNPGTITAATQAIVWVPLVVDKRYIKVRMTLNSGTIGTGLKYTAQITDVKPS
jgi:hypothetical protein